MDLKTVIQDIHRLNHQLELLERKYGLMSATFYDAYCSGEEPEDDAWVLDFEKWAGLYEVWRDRRAAYDLAVQQLRSQEIPVLQMMRPLAVPMG